MSYHNLNHALFEFDHLPSWASKLVDDHYDHHVMMKHHWAQVFTIFSWITCLVVPWSTLALCLLMIDMITMCHDVMPIAHHIILTIFSWTIWSICPVEHFQAQLVDGQYGHHVIIMPCPSYLFTIFSWTIWSICPVGPWSTLEPILEQAFIQEDQSGRFAFEMINHENHGNIR